VLIPAIYSYSLSIISIYLAYPAEFSYSVRWWSVWRTFRGARILFCWMESIAESKRGRAQAIVGSYGTRNVVGIGIISYWERPTDCILLILSKFSSPVGVLLSRGLA
jgi:hypothetical protein